MRVAIDGLLLVGDAGSVVKCWVEPSFVAAGDALVVLAFDDCVIWTWQCLMICKIQPARAKTLGHIELE